MGFHRRTQWPFTEPSSPLYKLIRRRPVGCRETNVAANRCGASQTKLHLNFQTEEKTMAMGVIYGRLEFVYVDNATRLMAPKLSEHLLSSLSAQRSAAPLPRLGRPHTHRPPHHPPPAQHSSLRRPCHSATSLLDSERVAINSLVITHVKSHLCDGIKIPRPAQYSPRPNLLAR